MDDMGYQSMMNYNSSYGGLLTGLLVLLIKFLIVILVLSIVIGIVIWIKNNYFKDVNLTKLMNQNPRVKSVVGIIVAILGLLFLICIFSYLTGNGIGYGYGMGNRNGYYNYGSGYSFIGIIAFLIKALLYVFVITLIVSIIAYVMKQTGLNHFQIFNTTKSNGNNDTAKNNTSTTNQYEHQADVTNQNIDNE